MLNKIIKLSKELISIPSTKENTNELKKVLETVLIDLKDFTIERFESHGILSVLVYKEKTRPKKFKIILNAHLDVVPGKDSQYKPYEKNGKLYGRGTDDMKAAAAVMILIFKNLANKLNYPIALQLVTDEEISGYNGANYQIKKGVRADFFITGETTQFNIKNEAKGIIWLKIIARGKSAHAAYLWRGKNALWEIKKVLDQFEKVFPVPKKDIWKTTANLATVSTSNVASNRVPDHAEATFDIRYIAEDKKTIKNKIKKIIPQNIKPQFLENEPVHYTNQNNQFIKSLNLAIEKILGKKGKIVKGHGASDARHFSRVGMDGIEFGPIGEGLHSDNEWVDIKSLENYYKILEKFLLWQNQSNQKELS